MNKFKKGLSKTGQIIVGIVVTILSLGFVAAMIISCLHGANVLDYGTNQQILNTITSSLLFLMIGGGLGKYAIRLFKKAHDNKVMGTSKKEIKTIENIYGKEVIQINEDYNKDYKQVIFKDGEKKLIKK